MSDDKIKIRDIEGSSEEVINFFKKTDLDIGDYMNSAKNIKIPFCAIVIASILFVVLLCIITVLDDDVKIKKILVIISVAVAFVNTALVYMSWKNKTLTGIIALGEISIFAMSLNVYTPKEIVKKAETQIEKMSNH